tara:strand:- start:8109 stop:9200 length:1092 start_codon:yes stop_codon:yes gene_type:complete
MKKRKIIHYSVFGNNEKGHGGQKRTNQIVNLLKKDYEVHELQLNLLLPRNVLKLVFYFFYGIKELFQLKIRMYPTIIGLIKIGHYSYMCRTKVKLNNVAFVIVEEFRNFGAILNLYAKSKEIPVIGVAHNIDSFVPEFRSNFTNLSELKYFKEELYLLKQCSFVITISREENWLLSLNKITAIYLPFIPSKSVINELNEIKFKRESIQNKIKPLLLGTVKNIPTKIGMTKLIRNMEENRVSCDVVGFGSESLLADFKDLLYVDIHGGVSSEELNFYLLHCTSMLVYQPPTTGVLTRVIECLMCGIPVYGNDSSLRSYHYLDGTFNLASYKNGEERASRIDLSVYYSEISDSENKIMLLIKELL